MLLSESVASVLSKLSCRWFNTSRDMHSWVEDKRDLPKRYHYANNRRIDDVIFDVDDGYFVVPYVHIKHIVAKTIFGHIAA